MLLYPYIQGTCVGQFSSSTMWVPDQTLIVGLGGHTEPSNKPHIVALKALPPATQEFWVKGWRQPIHR